MLSIMREKKNSICPFYWNDMDREVRILFLKECALTERQLECFVLYYIDIISTPSIAKHLGISTSAVSEHLKSARKKIYDIDYIVLEHDKLKRELSRENTRRYNRNYLKAYFKDNNRRKKAYAYNRCWRKKNKVELAKHHREAAKRAAKYSTYAHQIDFCEEVRRDPNSTAYLQVKCTESSCEKWFTPTTQAVRDRISSLNTIGNGECRFYCSEECKQKCSLYGQIKYPKGFKVYRSREVQPELAELVLKRDNYKCQRCGSKDNLECHHFEGIEQNPIESADVDMCITLCRDCHKLAHSEIGCRYIDLRRDNLCK